jgi:alpha-tubulin suppressor-like RCC1 family protein
MLRLQLMKRLIALTLLVLALGIAAGCSWPWEDDSHDGGNPNAGGEEIPVWSAVSAGGSHVAGIKSDGSLWVWGGNGSGQLGLGTWVDVNLPTRLGSYEWEQASAGDMHTFAVRANGQPWSWGSGIFGQLAISNNGLFGSNKPMMVTYDDDWTSVSAGDGHTLVLKDDGTVWMCGVLRSLPDRSLIRMYSLTKVGNDSGWVAIDAGGYDNLARKADGTLWAWGDNDYGQLGIGSAEDQELPARVGSATDWSDGFSAGMYHCAAIKQDGTLWAWGLNSYGQLGDGTTVSRNEPALIDNTSQWKSVSAGLYHTLAIRSDGTLWAWGSNTAGQLGNGSNANSLVPVQVGSANDWASVSAGWYFSMGIRSGGSMWAWGNNAYGQLGNGTNASSSVPVLVGGE